MYRCAGFSILHCAGISIQIFNPSLCRIFNPNSVSFSFCRTVTFVVILNVCVLLVEHHEMNSSQHAAFRGMNQAFIAFYCIEQALKLLAFSYALFFPIVNGKRSFSVISSFDFCVSLASLAEVRCSVLQLCSLLASCRRKEIRSGRGNLQSLCQCGVNDRFQLFSFAALLFFHRGCKENALGQ